MKVIDSDLSELAVIVVTMNPDISVLNTQYESIPASSKVIIVDNNSSLESLKIIKNFVALNNIELIVNNTNRGLATAINQGAEWAYQHKFSTMLLLDQDTEPKNGSIETLLKAFHDLTKNNSKLGCIGPRLIDNETGLDHGFHFIQGLRWTRIYMSGDISSPIEVSSVNGSGTLMSLVLFQELQGLDDDFFIDHVDTEWSFRLISSGYSLYGIPNAVFNHRMGDKSLKFWLFGWKVWPWRSPVRHHYLFRNAVTLMKRDYVPLVWKFWAAIKLTATFLVHLILDPQRKEQVKNMVVGISGGIRNKN